MSTRITAAEAAALGIESTARYDLTINRIIEADRVGEIPASITWPNRANL
jgi:hypothetical protein